jgi:DNA repair protein RecO (recombination protein O)
VPVGEYDRRIVLLTKECGKITAFAKGARRQNSHNMAALDPFSFGEFKLYRGYSAYNVMDVNILNYFENLRVDFIGAYYGMYFLEIADYWTRENNDEREMLKLLYQTIKALSAPGLKQELVRYIFELKTIMINGEFPGIPENKGLEESTIYTIRYIMQSPIESLYTFAVTDSVLKQIKDIADYLCGKYLDRGFKSLEILNQLL